MAGDDAIAQVRRLAGVRRRRSIRHERIELDERAGIEQEVEPLAGRQLPASMLLLDPRLAPTEKRFGAHPPQALDPFLVRGHGLPPSLRKDSMIEAGSPLASPAIYPQIR
ncbi:MAG TPA: hypothetical protein VFO73_07980 [Candidatus Limnocylindrales bacterium]|nr:hypothetical protein [Candidatus Limnocylindrales bacterium]